MGPTLIAKLLATALLSLLLLIGATAVSAGAATKKRVGAKVTLGVDFDPANEVNPATFYGKVRSKVARCERGRSVQLIYRPEGGGPAQMVGEDTTDRQGGYEIPGVLLPGTYVAKALRAEKGRVVCTTARAEPDTVTVD